jgi:hypothetical protein
VLGNSTIKINLEKGVSIFPFQQALGQMEERLTVTLEGRCGALEQRSITAMAHLRCG